MLRQMVKIANKLDSLGLTKEADVLDRYINKMAAAVTQGHGDVIYEDGRARGALGASLKNKFYASKPQTLSEFNGFLGQLVEEIGKIPGQKVFHEMTLMYPPKQGDTTWSGSTNGAFKDYAKAAGFPEAGTSWKDFAIKNRYEPTLFGIYKFWEDTIGKVMDKANSGASTVDHDFLTKLHKGSENIPVTVPSPTAQATGSGANSLMTEENTMSGYRSGRRGDPDAQVGLEKAMKERPYPTPNIPVPRARN